MYEQIRQFVLDDIKENGKNKHDIAKALGFSYTYLSYVLGGHREPSKSMLECLANYYDMAIVYYKGQYWIVSGEQKGEQNADSSN